MVTPLFRLARIFSYLVLAIVCFVLLGLLALRTQWMKRYLLNLGVEKVNVMLNGRLAVGGISGSLFGELELSDLSLVRGQDTICTIGRIALGYQLSPLLHAQIRIDSVIIDSVNLSIAQYPDSTWNVAGLTRPDTASVTVSETSDEPFGYTLLLDNFTLRNMGATVSALDTTMRLRFEDVLLQCSAMYADSAARLSLRELQVQLAKPLIRLERLAFDARQRDDSLTISNLVVETKRNRADVIATYSGTDTLRASGSMMSPHFDFAEFATVFPEISIAVRPEITLSGNLVKDSLYGSLTLSDDSESIDLDLTAYPVSHLLGQETRDSVAYRLRGLLTRVDIARWTGDRSLAYLANGTFAVDGRGLTPESMELKLTSDFRNCLVLRHRLDSASLQMSFTHGILNGSAGIASHFGSITVDSFTADISGGEVYTLSAQVDSLDLAPLLDNDSLTSDLNLNLHIRGQGFDTTRARAELALELYESHLFDVLLSGGQANVSYAPGSIIIDTLALQSGLIDFSAGGRINNLRDGALDFAATLPDLAQLHAFAGTDSLGGSAMIQGRLTGSLDSLTVTGTATGGKLRYAALSLQSLSSRFDIGYVDSNLIGTTDLRAAKILASGFAIDSLVGDAVFSAGLTKGTVHLATPDGLVVNSTVDLPGDSLLTAVIQNLTIDYRNQHWSGGGPETRVRLRDDDYTIEHFALAGSPDSSGETQRVAVEGRFSLTGAQDLHVNYDRIAIAPLADLMNMESELGGTLSGRLHLAGTADRPEVSGRTVCSNGLVQQFTFDSLALDYTYSNERLSWTGLLDPGLTGELTTSGVYPLHLRLTDSSDILLPDSPMEIQFSARQLPFAALGSMTDEMTITGGVINADITAAGSWNRPDMAGALTIGEASFAIEELGAEYDDLAMALSFNDNRIVLDSLVVARGKGFLRATGQLEFENTLMSGTLHATDFTLVADRMFLARHSNFEIQMSGNTNVQGSTEKPTFSGDITIDRARFYVPFLTDMAAKSSGTLESPPLLMSALYRDGMPGGSTTPAADSAELSVVQSFDYYRNLRGEMALAIPRNTWLKSPEMNIEISGDIRMVKSGPEDLELFGRIAVVRGKYTMYGKEFVIKEGTLDFTGGAEYNPDLNLIAQYVFRSPEREKHALVATITGKAFTPQVAFALDGSEISERDALAYVVFGRNMDDVTASGAGGGSGDMAKGVAANVLAGQLASTLGKSLALDVVEIDASSSLAGATITLGKYLTTDLFMSYQRGVGNPSEDEVTPVIVTLEYELTRNLALQLLQGDPKASGFDFVFKFAW